MIPISGNLMYIYIYIFIYIYNATQTKDIYIYLYIYIYIDRDSNVKDYTHIKNIFCCNILASRSFAHFCGF